jgi:hypothetical protein
MLQTPQDAEGLKRAKLEKNPRSLRDSEPLRGKSMRAERQPLCSASKKWGQNGEFARILHGAYSSLVATPSASAFDETDGLASGYRVLACDFLTGESGKVLPPQEFYRE